MHTVHPFEIRNSIVNLPLPQSKQFDQKSSKEPTSSFKFSVSSPKTYVFCHRESCELIGKGKEAIDRKKTTSEYIMSFDNSSPIRLLSLDIYLYLLLWP